MLLDIQSKEELSVNLSITNACNRRCAYCFQKDWYLSKKANAFTDESVREMPLEEFEKLCTWIGKRNKTLKLLGGEPLLYSKLPELLDIAEKAKKKIVFIPNISVEEPLFDRIYDRLSCDKPNVVSFLINTDYPASQEEIFMRNLRLLCKTKLSLGFSTHFFPAKKKLKSHASALKNALRFTKKSAEISSAFMCVWLRYVRTRRTQPDFTSTTSRKTWWSL